MKILSLFDGMACGALAMQAAGIEIDKYIAYEIDKYAIQTAQHNFPFIEERGDVFKADFKEYAGFDYLIGGSPCTYWSIAQTKNRETVASGMGWELFSQYVRALHEAKPRFFLYENNKSMSAAIRASITETFGFEPILINSALVSAQNRQRLYWCGIRQEDGTYKKADIQQPTDRGILLKDILESTVQKDNMIMEPLNVDGIKYCNDKNIAHICRPFGSKAKVITENEKAPTLMAAMGTGGGNGVYYAENMTIREATKAEPNAFTWLEKAYTYTTRCQGAIIENTLKKHQHTMVAESVCVAQRGRYDESGKVFQHYEAQPTGKTNNLTTVSKDNLIAEPICVNSKSGRAGVEGLQPSLQDRVYETAGKMPAVTTSFNPRIAEPVCVAQRGRYDAPIYEVKDGFITVKGNKYPIKLVDGFYIIRKLTVRECMRLQTVPEWYEWPVSKLQAYKMLGNGWTVEVIAHLLRGLK